MGEIRIGIVGIGNCASALIQGMEYCGNTGEEGAIGFMHWDLGGYRPGDLRVVAAFDIDARFTHLRGVAGIADSSSPGTAGASQDRPQAVCRVYGDGNLLWESGPLAGRGDHRAFACSVAGVDVLTFVAESQSPANISDLAWSDLKLFPNTETRAPETPNPPKTP